MLKHLAIIPDGNRRYAKLHNRPFREVYSKSINKLEELVRWCKEQKIDTLTIWGFSTENWKRSEVEVGLILELFEEKAFEVIKNSRLDKEGARIRVIGNLEQLPEKLQKLAKVIEEKTKDNKQLNLNLLLNYGGRDEIIYAVNKLLATKKKNVTEEEFKSSLMLPGEPDMIIRTSGEQRLSGIMPFQSTYAEIYFTKRYFPEFTKKDFLAAIEEFNRRQRRFGK